MINYLVLGEIGEADGPCSKHCSHLICIQKRHDAESPCGVCGNRIGLGSEVYLTDHAYSGGYVHRLCFEIEVSEIRQRLRKGLNGEGVPMLEGEDAPGLARKLGEWLIGEISNDALNSLTCDGLRKIQPNATRFRTVTSAERMEEQRKVDGVRRRGRRRAFLPAREVLAEEPPPDQEA